MLSALIFSRSLSKPSCATGSKGRAAMKPSKNQLVANTHVGHWKSRLWVIILFAALALVGLGIVLESSSAEGKDGTVATYVHGRVNVTIPYRAGTAGEGRRAIEVLGADDQVVVLCY